MPIEVKIDGHEIAFDKAIEAIGHLVRLCSPEEIQWLRTDGLGQFLREMTGNRPEPKSKRKS